MPCQICMVAGIELRPSLSCAITLSVFISFGRKGTWTPNLVSPSPIQQRTSSFPPETMIKQPAGAVPETVIVFPEVWGGTESSTGVKTSPSRPLIAVGNIRNPEPRSTSSSLKLRPETAYSLSTTYRPSSSLTLSGRPT
ncbi:MAG: hypothetical protein DDT19_00846 [Syntrophomonadaceae bacterium]|nr:hypothetical protein [Bacillota bacterium]